jgi:hypothetical protein
MIRTGMTFSDLVELLGITVPDGAETLSIVADRDGVTFSVDGHVVMPLPVKQDLGDS